MPRYDYITEITKFNQNHDASGRFASSGGGGTAPKTVSDTDIKTVEKIPGVLLRARLIDGRDYIKKEKELYSPFQEGTANENNFFKNTIATFNQTERPNREPDFVSRDRDGNVSSEYWYTENGVIRGSDHWGTGVASCDWELQKKDGNLVSGYRGEVESQDKTYGECSWDSFMLKTRTANIEGKEILTNFNNHNGNGDVTHNGKTYTKVGYKEWKEVEKSATEIQKFNPFHDSLGRFSSGNSYATFTTTTKDPKKQHWADMAIARLKQNASKQPAAPKQQAAPQQPAKPKVNRDKLGFADHDDADYHQLHSGRQYYQQQQLTAKQKKAVDNYLEAHAEPGSLYSHSQNMNQQMLQGKQLTGKYKQTHDGLMDAMHNIGYNIEASRYDHADTINSMLKSLGAGSNYENMSQKQLQKALVGQNMKENKFLSCSYNDFKNAPASSQNVFTNRAVKINYKIKAGAQGMMPGNGPGGNLGELILAPGQNAKIVGVRKTGQKVRRKGTQTYNQERIEIDIEIG